MPEISCLVIYECENCHEILRSKPGECCVYCSYGSVKCPSKQKELTEPEYGKRQAEAFYAKEGKTIIKSKIPLLMSAAILLTVLILQNVVNQLISLPSALVIYFIAYLLAGYSTLKKAVINILGVNITE